ncbi:MULTISPECIES: hypothetical protein [Mesorhizobium]|uniref:Uncharacterized protein n=1 Tax=Mesorhizobium denitrificans TaxID=2294114 RepID=A0A371XBN5_9HYPH|nr:MULTISPECIES: hypothetical protein [Mesorhizobium]RFC66622.1 hypothetical protein DY251_15345 [Mesorhizobium denitrificans]
MKSNLGIPLFAVLAVAATGYIVSPASAAGQTTEQICSAKYQAAKAGGTLNGQKWPAFYSDCAASINANGNAGAAANPAPASSTSKSSTTTATAPAKSTPASTSGNHQTTQQICSSSYQAAKAAGTLGGQTWPAYLSACSDKIKQYSDTSQPTPPEPTISKTAAKKVMPVANGNASPGEVAFQQRIHECASEWQQQKANGTLPNGAKWPQFWSQCNTQLKSQM